MTNEAWKGMSHNKGVGLIQLLLNALSHLLKLAGIYVQLLQ